jgi:drug/metabolite transporter (DMT)-like permease|eukprot:scaffold187_cov266-Chaetoceros_neogracile.AAC.21
MQDNATTGVLAAISAPFFMALGFIIWDVTWKESGGSAFALNLFKCNLASIGFLIASFIFGFKVSSANEENFEAGESVGFLILSGFIGIIIGDLFWLEALRQLGASKVLVVDTIKPFAAALLGWLILDEQIQNVAFSGIALTAVGVLIVSLESEGGGGDNCTTPRIEEQTNLRTAFPIREGKVDDLEEINSEVNALEVNEKTNLEVDNEVLSAPNVPTVSIDLVIPDHTETSASDDNATTDKGNLRRGYVLAIANVLLDTYGSLLTKQHGGHFSSWTINLIRFGSSGICMLVASCAMQLYNRCSDTKGNDGAPWYRLPSMETKKWMKICIGVLLVTFLCPALSNYALFQIALGLALTLGSISPLYAMLLEWPIRGSKSKPTIRSLCGASLAVGGVIILSLFSSEES